jgi:pimeloyl-ACP methyl ester carboxylesterase
MAKPARAPRARATEAIGVDSSTLCRNDMQAASDRAAVLRLLKDGTTPVSALRCSFSLSNHDPYSSLLLRARCHMAMGSVTAARAAYARAASMLDEAAAEAAQLEEFTANWLDHPARLAILFPVPAHHESRSGISIDGHYMAAPGVEVAWRIFRGHSTQHTTARQVGCESADQTQVSTSVSKRPWRAVVVYFHGNGETAADLHSLAPQFTDHGFLLMVVEFRGYGRSSATPPLLSTLLTDAEPLALTDALDDALADAGLPRELPACLFGRSIGSHPAIHLAAIGASNAIAHRTFHALILDSGVASVRHWTHRVAEETPVNGRPPIPGDLRLVGLLENCDKLAETPIPTLVLYGDADNVVPPFQAELLHRASAAGANTVRDRVL